MANDAIAAIATPPGRGGIGVVRISGPDLQPLLRGVVTRKVAPRHATRAEFRGADGSAIDQGLALFFPAPHSYTGEDVVELQAHGGPVVLQLLLARCIELGARVAAPGEFTQRAFLNDKLDLAQAESVADLIDASTAEAARCALRSLRGEFSQRINAMVQTLIELRMLVEATLDFPEEDVESVDRTRVEERLTRLRQHLSETLAASRQGSLLREGIQVVIAGAPNVGKSSLLNYFAGAERAIVTDIPGTTRDTIREAISIRGVPLHVIDTAGLRDPRDPVEEIGISKTRHELSNADLVLWVSDAVRPETHAVAPELAPVASSQAKYLHVINKIDLLSPDAQRKEQATPQEIRISAKTGKGVERLQEAILETIGWSGGEGIYMARARHLLALRTAEQHLEAAGARAGELELLAEELRLAQQSLGEITGEFTADDLLGEIFSNFCIGK